MGTTLEWKHAGTSDMVKGMAKRGFVAVNIEYDNMGYPGNNCSDFNEKAEIIIHCIKQICEDPSNPHRVDCSKGVATYGYSQGGQLARLVSNYYDKVSAMLAFSATIATHSNSTADEQKQCLKVVLPQNKQRFIIGEKDDHFGGTGRRASGVPATVIGMARYVSGYDRKDCASEYNCIQSDGSGYFVATSKDTLISPMDHIWSFTPTLNLWTRQFELAGLKGKFENAAADKPWGLTANLNWLAKAGKLIA